MDKIKFVNVFKPEHFNRGSAKRNSRRAKWNMWIYILYSTWRSLSLAPDITIAAGPLETINVETDEINLIAISTLSLSVAAEKDR